MHAEQDIGRENDFVGRVLDLQIVVNRFALVKQIFLPKRKAIRVTDDAAQNKNRDGSRAENFLRANAHKVNHADKQQDARKYQKSNRGADSRNRHEGRQKSPDDTANRVKSVEVADNTPVMFEVVGRVLD